MKHTRAVKGFGVPTMLALFLPVIILVGALALSIQSSSARRFAVSIWTSYVAVDLAEGAISEASHCVKLTDVFDTDVFSAIYAEVKSSSASTLTTSDTAATFPNIFLTKISQDFNKSTVSDPFPSVTKREYRNIEKSGGTIVYKMLTQFEFPDKGWKTIPVPGLARKVAQNAPDVELSATDLTVEMKPLTFRREYYKDPGSTKGTWVNWGVIQFKAKVRTRELSGSKAVREVCADRRFSLPIPTGKSTEVFNISTINLRTSVNRVD